MYSRHGRAYSESTHTSDPRLAERLLRARLATKDEDFLEPKTRRTRVDELADDLVREYRINNRRSIGNLETRWKKHLQPFFGGMRAVQVNPADLARYVDERQQQGAANGTINRELAVLQRAFYLGRQQRKLSAVPAFPHLVENNVRECYAEDAHCRKLVDYCPELWFRALVEGARTYGWRKSELLNLRVKQVDLTDRSERLEPGTTKNREGRVVTITNAVFVLLTACVQGKQPVDHVFTRADGKRVHQEPGVASMRRFPRATKIPPDLRRTAARNLRSAGVAEGVIMRIGGWKTRSVFERYAIIDQKDIRAAVEDLEASQETATIQLQLHL